MTREVKIVLWNICETVLNGLMNEPDYHWDISGHFADNTKAEQVEILSEMLTALDEELAE